MEEFSKELASHPDQQQVSFALQACTLLTSLSQLKETSRLLFTIPTLSMHILLMKSHEAGLQAPSPPPFSLVAHKQFLGHP